MALTLRQTATRSRRLVNWLRHDLFGLVHDIRFAYLPPLMVYFAYFAIMAAFTNLALSASNLATKYLNRIFVVQRGEYDELGALIVAVALTTWAVPTLTVMAIRWWQRTGKAINP